MGANDKKDLLRLPRVFGETSARLPVVELRLWQTYFTARVSTSHVLLPVDDFKVRANLVAIGQNLLRSTCV